MRESVRKRQKEEVIKDLFIAGFVIVFLSLFIVVSDLFDHLYELIRNYESLGVGVLFAVLFSFLVAGTVISIRHALILAELTSRLIDAHELIEKQSIVEARLARMSAIGQLASGLAHEINNSLQPIVGLGPFVREKVKEYEDEKYLTYMNTILESVEHAQKIMANVLVFSHEEDIELVSCRPFDLFNESIAFVSKFMPSGVDLKVHDATSECSDMVSKCYIYSNKTAMLQIFVNIVKNASHSMNDEGSVYVKYSFERFSGDPDRPYACVSITDTGSGMDKDTVDRIFDPFFTTKDVDRGSGLGMSIVHDFIKQHNGHIKVESEPGKGSTFRLYFPVVL